MNDKLLSSKAIFDSIKHIDENGKEYWEARELQKALEYKQWCRFESVIKKAINACKQNKNNYESDFANVDKIVEAGATRKKGR